MFGKDESTLSTSAGPAHHEVGCENGIWEMKKPLRITEKRRRFQALGFGLLRSPSSSLHCLAHSEFRSCNGHRNG